MLTRFPSLCAIVMISFVSGCASVPMATTEQDDAAKSFATKPGKANIYVYRNESLGLAVKMPVAPNGKLVGDTAAKTYLLLEVDPGRQTQLSKTEIDSTLHVDAIAGRNHIVWQEVKMGSFAARSSLHLVDEMTGSAAVAECKLIEVAR